MSVERGEKKAVNIPELRAQFSGRRFCQLIEHHLRRQSQRQRIQGIKGTVNLLPEKARHLPEGFIDRWNTRIYDQEFWQRDTSAVFDEIIDDARLALQPLGLDSDDEAAFNLFNIVVLSYAYSAYDQPKMREFMGIGRGYFPWPSAVALAYPLAATVYAAKATPAGVGVVLGYGLANLAYLLVGAGILSGSFRIFGLKSRWQVFGASIMAFLVGTALSNIGT